MMGSRKTVETAKKRQHRMAYPADDIGQRSAFDELAQKGLRNTLLQQLYKEQRGLCVYCGQSLDLERNQYFHVEHFKPQALFGSEACSHSNMFLSCGHRSDQGNADWCGQKKGNIFNAGRMIDPDHPVCTNRFNFKTKGKIVPALENDTVAQEMIDLLNLNTDEMKRERKALIRNLDAGKIDGPWKNHNARIAISYGHVVARKLAV